MMIINSECKFKKSVHLHSQNQCVLYADRTIYHRQNAFKQWTALSFIRQAYTFGFVWKEWEFMSHNECTCFSICFFSTLRELAFCVLLCYLRCHLKWAADYRRWRLPAWRVSVYALVRLSSSEGVRVSRLQVIADGFWQVARDTPESWSEMTD